MADPDYLAYLSFLTERRISPSGLSEYLHAEDGDDEMDIDFIGMPPSDGPNSASVARSSQESVDIDDSAVESDNVVVVEDEDEDEDGSNERRNYNNSEGGEMSSSKDNKDEEEKVDAEEELNRDEIDGLICPICFEAWSSGGDHRVWLVFYVTVLYYTLLFSRLIYSCLIHFYCLFLILVVFHVGISMVWLALRNGCRVEAQAR